MSSFLHDSAIKHTEKPAFPSSFEGVISLASLMNQMPTTFDGLETSTEDFAIIVYTLGTTRQPKDVELSHINLVMNAMVLPMIATGKILKNELRK